ncbi:protein mesh-like isoform X2 [Pecten maximus]|uniref:protein mesh-like isoform X2 n=1 Tax=Pecten maximus TaxID=6579 RepID=UPI0014586D76|nr:protein mesh-like isoform X2 [Pecten maximus]
MSKLALVLILSITKLSHSIPIDEFYPFGESYGDSDFPKNDDGSSPAVTISTLFPFFNNQHDVLYVNTNGVISFLGTLSQYTPDSFPLSNSRRLIAPFWADVDIRKGGTVWYRETTNTSILQRATDEVRLFYPSQSSFVAAWVFIATWDDVAFYGSSPDVAQRKRNSFQAILITNGRHSFTIFNYYNITWTTGTASGGDSEGLGGTPAQVGFNAGDGINYYAVNESRTDDIINLPRLSNVHVDGKFVFRIDTETIEQGGCNTGGTLTISPRYSHMFGGEKKVLAGPCIHSNDTVTATFGGDGTTSVNCTMESMYSVTCVTPIFYKTGDVSVKLNVVPSNQQSIQQSAVYEGIINILNPLNTKSALQRLDPSNWRRGEEVTMKWSSSDIPFYIEGSTVEIYTVKPDLDLLPRLEFHSSVVQYIESSQSEVSFTLETEDDVILISLVEVTQPNDQRPRQRIWSDAVVVVPRYINESKLSCNKWQTTDDELPSLSEVQVQVCPCRFDQADIDLIRFHLDPVCQSQDSSNRPGSNCLFYPKAKQCFRLNTPGPIGTGQLCCYDNNGNVMDMLTSSGGGSLQRFHYFGDTEGAVPYLSNIVFDTAPYYHCCMYPQLIQWGVSSECFGFYQRRTPGNCNGYVPNIPAQNFGDPHFMTPDGLSYTFNGVGEFTLFRTTSKSFIAQVRMQSVENNGINGSVITSFVAKAVNMSDTIEVKLNSIRAFDILVNGVVQDITGVTFLRYKGVTISVRNNNSTTNDHTDEVNIAFPGQDISFQTFVYESFLTFIVSFGSVWEQGSIEGLLGNFNQDPNDDLISQHGDSLPADSSTEDIHNNMGLSWRIIEEESLFTYAVGTSHASIQDNAFVPLFDIPVSAIDNTTRYVCGDDTFCYYDNFVTKDTTLASSTRTSTNTLTRIQEISRKTVTCGFPPAVEYGQWNISGMEIGYTGKLVCNSEIQLKGSGYITCSTEGHWTDSQSTCLSSVATTTIGQDTADVPTSDDSWIIPVVVGITSSVVLFIIILLAILLVRRFCFKEGKATGSGDDKVILEYTREFDNAAYMYS